MDIELLRENWGLVVATVLFVLLAAIFARAMYRQSAQGMLGIAQRKVRLLERQRDQLTRRAASAERRVAKLRAHQESVKPRAIAEASDALADAKALAKIADDQWLVAAQQLRRVIYEEFPPSRHDALREKYLPDDGPDKRPFSF
jgi:hypothetical protein